MHVARRTTALAALGAAALVAALTGCADNTADTASNKPEPSAVTADPAVVALVPAEIADSGSLVVGVNLEYSPNEFKDPEGAPTGWGVELVRAVAEKMGLEIEYKPAPFDNILPNVIAGTYDVGLGSFTDTQEREKTVDFVTYYSAGTRWAGQAGSTVDPEDACGLTVAVGATTFQETDDLPARSKACTDAGKPAIDIMKLETQGDITNAVVLGRADAFAADSPVAAYAVKATEGKLELIGEQYDSAPFGLALAQDSALTEAVRAAVQSVMDDGTYAEILDAWGVQSGAIETAEVNGALF